MTRIKIKINFSPCVTLNLINNAKLHYIDREQKHCNRSYRDRRRESALPKGTCYHSLTPIIKFIYCTTLQILHCFCDVMPPKGNVDEHCKYGTITTT